MAVIPPSTAPKRTFDPIPAVDEYKTPVILPVEVVSVTLRDINPAFRERYNIEAEQEFNLRFKVVDGPFKNRNIFGTAQAIWHDGASCRLRVWAQEILGVNEFDPNYVFDSDHLVGKLCRVTVKNYQKKDGTVGDSVADVMRADPALLSKADAPESTSLSPQSAQAAFSAAADTEFEPF
jgi:hypothetical protein